MTGAEITSLMRRHKVTIRELKARTGITMKRIRQVRERGLGCRHAKRDWIEAITGTDPGPQTISTRRRIMSKFPNIEVQMTGNDGNAFAVLGAVQKALRKAGVPQEERDQFHQEATSGDYNHLLATCMEWVECA